MDLSSFDGLDERIEVDTSEAGTSYLLVGRNGSHIRLSPSAYNLLKIVESGVSFEDAAANIRTRSGEAPTPQALEEACGKVVDYVLSIDQDPDQRALPKGFWFHFPLLRAEVVGRLVHAFTWLFHPGVALGMIAAIVASIALMSIDSLPELNPADFWGAYGLFLLSLVFHEIGHATSCQRFGACPYTIGFTLYLVYPAFYADVSTAWRLSRWQRVVVDLAGAYFQFLVGISFVALYFVTGSGVFSLAFWMIVYSMLFALNPVFKFDGYWVLADALGVTNLGSKPFMLIGRLFRHLRGLPVEPLAWPKLVTAVLVIYTPLTFLFWGYFLSRLLPMMRHVVYAYPEQVSVVFRAWSAGDPAPEGSVAAFTMSSFFVLIFAVIAWRLGKVVGKLLREGMKRLVPRSNDQVPTGAAESSSVIKG